MKKKFPSSFFFALGERIGRDSYACRAVKTREHILPFSTAAVNRIDTFFRFKSFFIFCRVVKKKVTVESFSNELYIPRALTFNHAKASIIKRESDTRSLLTSDNASF